MIGSFIVLVISIILAFIFDELSPKFSFIEEYIMPYIWYVVIGLAIIFALFVIIEIINKVFKGR